MREFICAIAACLAILTLASMAQGQSEPKKSPFALPQAPTGQSAQPSSGGNAAPGAGTRVWLWILNTQQKLHKDMAAAVRELKAAGSLQAAWILAFISFMYGVFHAAGPGHGKAVISSYVLANERTVRRGVYLSFLAAIIQALSAITIVGVLAIALNATSLTIKSTENWIETLSWAFVALVGAWMLAGQIKAYLAKPDRSHHSPRYPAVRADGHHHHGHDHNCCGHDHLGHSHARTHSHSVAHDHAECCGHAHMPAPSHLEGELGWRKALAIAFSVGVRPCSGAIIVLIFALSQGMLWAGVFATFAMALGTAITVSALAALAVGSRELATRLAGPESRWADRIGLAAGFTGSTLVLLMGTTFFFASLSGSPPV